MPDNLLSMHFNTEEFKAEAAIIEKIAADLYASLQQYDNKKISPINIAGLTELTSAIKLQQTQMESLTAALANLSVATGNYNAMLATNANATVTSGNATAQNSQILMALNATLAQNVANTTAATNATNANTTATNSNTTAGAGNAAGKKKQIDYSAMMGQNALKENDALGKLYEKQKLYQGLLANSIINKAPKATQDVYKNQLREVNVAINEVDKTFRKTEAGGLLGMGRGMGSLLNQVRQLAYILPGIGMAGIFNLAFQVLGDVFGEMTKVNDQLADMAKLEGDLADAIDKANAALKDQADAYADQNKEAIRYLDTQIKIQNAGGEGYAAEMQNIDALNKAKKDDADETVQAIGATVDEQHKLNTEMINQGDVRKKTANEIASIERDLTTLGTDRYKKTAQSALENQQVVEMVYDKNNKGLKIWGGSYDMIKEKLEKLKDSLTKQAEAQDKQLKATTDRYNMVSTALTNQSNAGATIQEEAAKRTKYYSDEERAIRLSNAQATYNGIKTTEQAILDNKLSTTQQRIDATQKMAKAEDDYAAAQKENVTTKIGVKPSEITEATNTYNEKVKSTKEKTDKEVAALDLDFWLKMNEQVEKGNQDIYKTQQLYNKAIYTDDQETYENRFKALGNYNKARADAAKSQYEFDLKVIEKTVPKDLREGAVKERTLRFAEENANIENGIRQDSYNIAVDFYKKQLKVIEDFNEDQVNISRNAETEKLTDLNNKLNSGKESYKKYQKDLAKITYDGQIEIDKAQLAADQEKGKQLADTQKDLQSKLGGAILGMGFSTPGSKGYQEALGAAQGFTKNLTDNTKAINENNIAVSKDANQLAIDQNKNIIDAEKQTMQNWKELQSQAFEDVKQIGDSYFEDRMSQIEKLTEAYDKQADAEKEALDKSTLAAKDKNAYEVQLAAQKKQRDGEAAKEVRRLKYDEAVFNRAIDIAKIITNTEVAVSGAMASVAYGVPYPVALGEAISAAALGATALATAVATKIPTYAFGGTHKKSGLALFGENGEEMIIEPGKMPYVAKKPTLKHLPANTELVPLYQIPEIGEKRNDSWEQTMYLGKQIQKSKREIKNIFKPKIVVDLGREAYINRILGI